jgi:hypothetical protein
MWDIDIDVAPGNPNEENGKNEGGIIIYLVRDDEDFVEVCRVRFIRRDTANPKKGFRRVLSEKLADANAAKNALNKMDIDIQETKDRLDDLLDRADALRNEALGKVTGQGSV